MSFLKREWLDSEGQPCKGAKHNESLQLMIRWVTIEECSVFYPTWKKIYVSTKKSFEICNV